MLHPFEMFGGTYILTEWRAFGSAFLFCEFTPLYGLNPCFFKKREKHVPWPLEKLQPKQYQGRVLAKNRKNTSLGPNIHTISCRPKGRSAPLACCLPCATGRRCCHGALPHRVWRPGAPLTAPEHCGTHARRASIRTAACQAAPTAGCEGGYHRESFAGVLRSTGKSPIRRATNSELLGM